MNKILWISIIILVVGVCIAFFITKNTKVSTASSNEVTGEWYWEKFSEQEIQSWSKFFLIETGEVIQNWQDAGVKRVLDVGAGQGHYSMRLARNGFKVDALDINDFSMKRLKKLATEQKLKINTVTADARKMPYADNTFDAVIAAQVVNLLGCKNVVPMLREICRVLKPNGQIYFTLDALENSQPHDISHSSASLTEDRYSMEYCLFDTKKIQETILPIIDAKKIFKTTYVNPQTMDTFMTKYSIIGTCKK